MLTALSMYASVVKYINESKLNKENIEMSEPISDHISIDESMLTTIFKSVETHELIDYEANDNSNMCALLFRSNGFR